MTGPAPEETFAPKQAIDIVTDTDRKFTQLFLHDRRGLANTFIAAMAIQDLWHNGNKIIFSANDKKADEVKKAFAELSAAFGRNPEINKQIVKEIAMKHTSNPPDLTNTFSSAANQNSPRPRSGGGSREFVAKNPSQAAYAEHFRKDEAGQAKPLVFGLGPAGTGKTFVPVYFAIQAFLAGEVKKIIITRPAQESGERLGFLPGSADDKMSPYMRPIYDELDKAFGPKYKRMMQDGVIEIAPLGFMRGRTFTDAFIIVDEAQNCTKEQTKMYLTRMGENCRMAVTGDQNQIDLQNKEDSGLMWAAKRLQGKPGVAVHEFNASDVMRSPIVATIVAALDETNAVTLETTAAPEQKPQRKQGTDHKPW